MDELQSKGDPGTVLVLVGNKKDLEEQRKIDKKMASNFANRHAPAFMWFVLNYTTVSTLYTSNAQHYLERVPLHFEKSLQSQE